MDIRGTHGLPQELFAVLASLSVEKLDVPTWTVQNTRGKLVSLQPTWFKFGANRRRPRRHHRDAAREKPDQPAVGPSQLDRSTRHDTKQPNSQAAKWHFFFFFQVTLHRLWRPKCNYIQ